MRVALRALVVVAVFLGVGWWTAHFILVHRANAGAYEPQVKLGADMAGLFAGGAAALITLIALLRGNRR